MTSQADDIGRARRISLAFFLAGFATFSLLYCVQPLLPLFSSEFGVTPSASSFALSFTTFALAFAIIGAAPVAERFGRRPVIGASLCLAVLCTLLVPLCRSWGLLVGLRLAEGVALGGVPAVAMAYLAEETPPARLAAARGLYIAGNAFGGMMGRVLTGFLTGLFGWRLALAGLGGLDMVATVGFWLLLPPPRHGAGMARPRFSAAENLRAWGQHLRHPALALLFFEGFAVMGVFVTSYNYIGYRLGAAPYSLSQSVLGALFLVYAFGMVASGMAGRAVRWLGYGGGLFAGLVLQFGGIVLTLGGALWVIMLGITLLTIGFFLAHAVASGWVGHLASVAKGHASSLYLLAYYIGSSVVGSSGGLFYHQFGWRGLVGFVLVISGAGLAAALGLARLTRAPAT